MLEYYHKVALVSPQPNTKHSTHAQGKYFPDLLDYVPAMMYLQHAYLSTVIQPML